MQFLLSGDLSASGLESSSLGLLAEDDEFPSSQASSLVSIDGSSSRYSIGGENEAHGHQSQQMNELHL